VLFQTSEIIASPVRAKDPTIAHDQKVSHFRSVVGWEMQ
jgi:hypothetical protein